MLKENIVKLLLVAKVVLVLWIIRDVVVSYGSLGGIEHSGIAGVIGGSIGYVLFDVRVWMLVIGILLLRYRNRKQAKASSSK
jgi:hypothetical protein